MHAKIAQWLVGMVCLGFAPAAFAQADPGLDSTSSAPSSEDFVEDEVEYGIQLRAHYIGVPKSMIELFVDEAPSGAMEPGFGIELVRRRDDSELSFGVGYDRLRTDDGLFVEKGDTSLTERTDLVEFDGFGWLTFDVRVAYSSEITDFLLLRYGAGFGIGILTGDVLQTDTICPGATSDSCTPVPPGTPGAQVDEPADIFPVMPVLSLFGGLQVRPTDGLMISLEAGLRTALYAGTTVGWVF